MRRWSIPYGTGLVVVLALVAVTAGIHRQGAQAAGSVSIHDFSFDPASVSVTAGDAVTWTNNQSGVTHTVTADDGGFDSGRLTSGQTFTMTFARAGTFTYHCNIHPSMHGTVQVSAAPSTNGGATSGVAGATSRAMAAGFNLIGVPTGTQVNATAVDAFDPASNNYRALGTDEQLVGGQGYWAFFDGPATVSLPAGSNTPVSVNSPSGAWMLIGNPSGTLPALVTGADEVFTFDAAGGHYVATTTVQPGDGAWAMSVRGGTITIAPGATTAPSTTPSPTPSPMPAAASTPVFQPTQQPTPVRMPTYVPPYRY